MEWTIFIISAIILLKSRDVHMLLQPHNSNLILIIPLVTVLLPTFLSYPLDVPSALIIPHLAFLILLSVSLLIDVKQLLTNHLGERNKRYKKNLKAEL